MLVVIAGAGNVGKYLIESFLEQKEDIVVIENNEAIIKSIQDNFDVLVIKGNMLSHFILRSANVQSSELFIASSNFDSNNILACQLAKRLGARHSIARVYSEEIFPQNDEVNNLEKYLGIDWLVSPSRLAGYKLAYALFDNKELIFDSYFDAHLDLVQITISRESELLGKKSNVFVSNKNIALLQVARNNAVVNHQNLVFQENDEIIIVGKNKKMVELISEIYSDIHEKNHHIYLAGASRAVLSALSLFQDRLKYITVIDKDLETCRRIEEKHDKIRVLNIDPSDFNKLNNLNFHKEGVFVCASENDADNLTYSLNAEDLDFSQIIPLVNQYDKMRLFRRFKFDQIISLPFLAAQEIFRYFNQYIKKDFQLLKGNKARAITKEINSNSSWIGQDIKKIMQNYSTLDFVALSRKGEVFIKKDKEVKKIQENDKIIISSFSGEQHNLKKILDEK